MIDEKDLRVGEWYWAVPAYDVDDDRTFKEQSTPIPAKYLGLGKWLWPDTEGDHWPCSGLIYEHIKMPGVE